MTGNPDKPSGTLPKGADWVRAAATRKVISALTGGGQPARFVGGCVRDTLMGRPIADVGRPIVDGTIGLQWWLR